MNKFPSQQQMETNSMGMQGAKELGVLRVPVGAIPKMSKTMSKFGSGKGNDKGNDPKNKVKLKKIMQAQGMLQKV